MFYARVINRRVNGTLFLSHPIANCDCSIPWDSHRASNTKHTSNDKWVTLGSCHLWRAQQAYFLGITPLYHGTDALRLLLTVLSEYNIGILLQKIPDIW